MEERLGRLEDGQARLREDTASLKATLSEMSKRFLYFLRKVADTWLVKYVRVNIARHKLRKTSNELHELDEIVDFTSSFGTLGISIKPAQVRDEIRDILRYLSPEPRVILEIGTASGGTLFMFTRIAQPDATVISIDLPGVPFGGGYPNWKVPPYKSFARKRQKIYLVRGDSHDPVTALKVKKILSGRKIDFLFIDGDHTYEGVKRDFEIYSKFVRSGGIIAYHDIVEHPHETRCEVSKFWNEVKHVYKHLEIVKDWNQKWAGIGVIYV